MDDIETLRHIYDRFNARDIHGVLSVLADDVSWANGMEGGHVLGRDAVRDYWTRQWAVVSPRVEPTTFQSLPDGAVAVIVRQSVSDLEGRPLRDRTHGLVDKTVRHVFRFVNGKVIGFDIEDAP